MKIPVYFYEVGFGFVIYDSNQGELQPAPYPYLILGSLDSNQQVIVHSNGGAFPIASALPYEVNAIINPNLEKLPLDAFRPAGMAIDPN